MALKVKTSRGDVYTVDRIAHDGNACRPVWWVMWDEKQGFCPIMYAVYAEEGDAIDTLADAYPDAMAQDMEYFRERMRDIKRRIVGLERTARTHPEWVGTSNPTGEYDRPHGWQWADYCRAVDAMKSRPACARFLGTVARELAEEDSHFGPSGELLDLEGWNMRKCTAPRNVFGTEPGEDR